MAMPIRSIPVLEGEVARRFIKEAKENEKKRGSIKFSCGDKDLDVGFKNCEFIFSLVLRKVQAKIRSKTVVGKNPYFHLCFARSARQRAPLIEKQTQPSRSLTSYFVQSTSIPLLSSNKGIRGDEKGAILLLRELSQNKGSIQNRTNNFFMYFDLMLAR